MICLKRFRKEGQRYLFEGIFSIELPTFMAMTDSSYTVLGVMSGTSLDGIDLAIANYHRSDKGFWSCDFVYAKTEPYSRDWKQRLSKGHLLAPTELEALDKDYTDHLGKVIANFIRSHTDQAIDLVASHGHTILHQPENGFTLQIGNLPAIRALVGLPVVCNFRVQDVDLGGQGAPLVPIGDRLLFGMYDSCLNLGGFGNCSFEEDGKRIAFDICPVNIVLNPLAEQLGKEYDDGGQLARSGTLIPRLLAQLNALTFYSSPPPKSLGLEWVMEHVWPILKSFQAVPAADLLRTFVEHIAIQLAAQLPQGRCLVTGGGAYNRFLIERLKDLTTVAIDVPDSWLVDNKEALIFGLLGVLRLRDEVNCLSSVTGASRDHSSGVVYP